MNIRKKLKKIKPLVKIVYAVMHIINSKRILSLEKRGYICRLKKSLFFLPFIKTDEIQRCIFFGRRYYENDYLDYLSDKWRNGVIGDNLREGTFLDIGANIGNHSLYFLLECGAKFAYCFEPAKETFDILKKNMEINHLEYRTKLFNAGVGASSGNASISMSKEKNTAYTQITLNEEGDVQVISIDELEIKEKINFIKVDVEGFEVEVLKGMAKTLKRDKPIMMIEIWATNLNDVHAILDPLGYQFELMSDRISQADYVCYIN